MHKRRQGTHYGPKYLLLFLYLSGFNVLPASEVDFAALNVRVGDMRFDLKKYLRRR
jgi:hypothetical protein